jgi:predicted ATPase
MDEELEANLQRIAELCRELEDDAAFVPIFVGLGRLQIVRADRAAIAELEQQEERTIERLSDAHLRVQLHTQLATIATFRGQHARAAEQYQHVLAQHDPQVQHSSLLSFGGDPLIVASSSSGLSLSLAGQPEQGWSRIAQALARAEEASQPFALVNGLLNAAMAKLLCGEYDEAGRLAQKMDALTRKHHFSLYKILAGMLQGSIAVRRGALVEGITDITNGLSQYRTVGAQLLVPFFLSFLAEGYRQQGKLDEALQIVSKALSLTATNLDVFWQAELYRLKGEFTFAQSSVQRRVSRQVKSGRSKIPTPQAEAEACFQQAGEIARQQGAKVLELRAAMSLARLWQQQGKQDEACNTLANIYNWFSEGFDTVDLQTARTLLAEWSTASQSTV